MPAWVTIYCIDPVDTVRPDELLSGIGVSDYDTLAEQYELDERLVAPVLARLQIKVFGDNLRLHYRIEGERQLEIHRWSDPCRIAEEIREVLEQLDGDGSSQAAEIRSHLSAVHGVVAVEMGFSQLEDMGVVFAYEVARWFTHNCRGLIRCHDDTWLRTDDGAFVDLYGQPL